MFEGIFVFKAEVIYLKSDKESLDERKELNRKSLGQSCAEEETKDGEKNVWKEILEVVVEIAADIFLNN